MSPRTPQKPAISGIHLGRVTEEQKSSEELLLLSLQCCSFRRDSQVSFLIRAAVAGWYHPKRGPQSGVYVSAPDPGCVHRHHFRSREERPMGLSEEPKGDNPPFPLIASAAPRACTALYPWGVHLYNLLCNFFPQGNIAVHIPRQGISVVLELATGVTFVIQKWCDGGPTKKAEPLVRNFLLPKTNSRQHSFNCQFSEKEMNMIYWNLQLPPLHFALPFQLCKSSHLFSKIIKF